MAARFYDANTPTREMALLGRITSSIRQQLRCCRERTPRYARGSRNAEPSPCSMSLGRMTIEAEQRSASERQGVLGRTLGLLVSAGGQQTLTHLVVDRRHSTIVSGERSVVFAEADLPVPFANVLWSGELRQILVLCHDRSIRRFDGPTHAPI